VATRGDVVEDGRDLRTRAVPANVERVRSGQRPLPQGCARRLGVERLVLVHVVDVEVDARMQVARVQLRWLIRLMARKCGSPARGGDRAGCSRDPAPPLRRRRCSARCESDRSAASTVPMAHELRCTRLDHLRRLVIPRPALPIERVATSAAGAEGRSSRCSRSPRAAALGSPDRHARLLIVPQHRHFGTPARRTHAQPQPPTTPCSSPAHRESTPIAPSRVLVGRADARSWRRG
jgi:hypothetical protein